MILTPTTRIKTRAGAITLAQFPGAKVQSFYAKSLQARIERSTFSGTGASLGANGVRADWPSRRFKDGGKAETGVRARRCKAKPWG